MRRGLLALVFFALAGASGAALSSEPAPAVVSAPASPAVAGAAPVVKDASGRPTSHPLVGRRIPAFTAELSTGAQYSSRALRGRWTVIQFWGVWCGDCQRDADHTAAFARAADQDPGLDFLTVHVDTRSGRWPSVNAYLAEKAIAYPVILDPDRTLYRAFEMQWVPTYLVVDPQGVVRAFRTDLSRDDAPDGGVKAFVQQIAALRGRDR
ncbi:MAG: TlpA disulfide reductase family protein [Hyphomonadaceae bacterium]|nr:TlpA disulfide reductase family protein [Hyphomonadaceae bacterium]